MYWIMLDIALCIGWAILRWSVWLSNKLVSILILVFLGLVAFAVHVQLGRLYL
jgi:hypothetical protein